MLQINLQIQCNSYQTPSLLFCRKWQADPKIHVKTQEIQNSQTNLDKEQIWRAFTS